MTAHMSDGGCPVALDIGGGPERASEGSHELWLVAAYLARVSGGKLILCLFWLLSLCSGLGLAYYP